MKAAGLALAALCALAPAPRAGASDPTTFAAGRAAVAEARARLGPLPRARNVIVFLGDGMGISTVTAARILEGQLRGEPGEENLLSFETFPHLALIKTYNTNQQTSDSAGTMTAIVTGEKTRAGVLSVGRDVARGDFRATAAGSLATLLEQAEDRGLATGIVTTTTLTHATPAALYAHAPERSWESDDRLPDAARRADFPDLARQFVEFAHGDGVEVALAGGRRHFMPQSAPDPEYPEQRGRRTDGRDLIAEWLSGHPGAVYVWNRKQLVSARARGAHPLLGLFEPSHMNFEVDRDRDPAGEPSLAEMTDVAIEILRRSPRGYLLMVEGGRIDHGHHAGNAYRALHETVAFSDAVRLARKATDPADTLIVVTADHSHVMTVGGYPTRGNPILGKVTGNDDRGEPADALSLDATGRPYTTLGYDNGPGARRAGGASGAVHGGSRGRSGPRADLTDVDTEDPDYLQEAAVPMDYETHGAEDVPAYASGPGAALFSGVREQHYIYHAIVSAWGWGDAGPDEEETPP